MDASARGQRIARARRRRGLSQVALAGLAGRSESWLSQVERGLRPVDSHSVLVSLADILHVDVRELTGDEDVGGGRIYAAVPAGSSGLRRTSHAPRATRGASGSRKLKWYQMGNRCQS